MPSVSLRPESSALVVIDVQPKFLAGIYESERVVARSAFLAETARRLDVPVLATEQVPARMGGTHERLAPLVGTPMGKASFSCLGCSEFVAALEATGRRQVVIVGIETHICVSLTAQGLLAQGYEVIVCPDAVSAGDLERHKLGMERIRDAGVVPAHSEAVAYEWLGTAEHPEFRDVLKLVKNGRV